MSNIIKPIEIASEDDRLIMSNQGTDCLLDLLLCAARTLPQTETQSNLISFLEERKETNLIAPGTAGFNLNEMPWNEDSLDEDVAFLESVIQTAQKDSTFEMLPYEANKDIVLPWLQQLETMTDQLVTLMSLFYF